MGNSSRATVAFGVDLGNPQYGEWNFEEVPDSWDSVEEDGEEVDFDDLILEFAGWDEVELHWNNDEALWSAQLDRKRKLLKPVGIEVGAWGYEYSGKYLYIAGTEQSDTWAPVAIKPIFNPPYLHIERLVEFIEFLDGKGAVLKEEFRRPRWLLMSSYG